MNAWLQDLRYALRTFTKSPGFSAVAVLTLALGIGANASIFALVDRVLIRPLPVRDPERLVLLRSPGPSQGNTWSDDDEATSFSYPMYRDLADRATVFEGLIGELPFQASVATRGETETSAGELVTGNYFSVLGVPPAVGRVLTAADDRSPGGHPLVVLSHGYWSRRFGSDPRIVGQTIRVNDQLLTVVGVADASFEGIQPGRRADLFVPMMMKAQMTPGWHALDDPKSYWLQMVGRLKRGLSIPAAERALAPTYRALLAEVLPRITGWSDVRKREFLNRRLELLPGARGRRVLRDGIGTPLLSLMAMVGLVLLIACSNLAGLLAARGAARQREYGIRLAIGASRFQLLRQSLLECLVYAVVGGGLGILVAQWALQALLGAFPSDDALRQVGVSIDPRVLLFASAVSLVAAVIFGAAPSWRAARLDPAKTIRGQGRGTASAGSEVIRFRQWLVTGQVALTLILLVAAGLFAQSLRNLWRVDLGLKPDHVIGFSVSPALDGYSTERALALARQLTEDLRALPGVRSATVAQISTLTGNDSGGNVTVEGQPELGPESAHARRNRIGPDYFVTLGIPLLAGRSIAWTDDVSAPKVAVVNQTFAKTYFPGGNALGQRFVFGGPGTKPDTEIVGIVADSKGAEVAEKPVSYAYLSLNQPSHLVEMTFYARTEQDPATLASAIRELVHRRDPQLPIDDLKTLTSQVQQSLLTERLMMLLSVAFGVLAALLAALGVYGVLSFAVAERRQEIGVRMALGADPAAVRRLVLGDVARFLLVGTAIGLPCAYVLARAVESILFGVRASDPSIFALGAALMVLVALAAGWPPAARAARTDALDALRSE
ncbi:MAG TPA: ABC transporter permease [Thermoanaerobaculia bacterium]|nr:ABC transporter permease [Thermoanaerobaculia bacterium]